MSVTEKSKKIYNIGGRRKSEYRNKIDLNKFSDHSHSANWQRFVSDEFSRRMKDLLMGVRLESFDLMSPDRKARPTKCKCCQVKNFYTCYLQVSDKLKSLSLAVLPLQ
jgi:hypothetical protein